MDFFVDLTSVGTFFAFILVCAGVLYMDHSGLSKQSRFRVPYINGRYLIGSTFLATVVLVLRYDQAAVAEWQQSSLWELLEHKLLVIIFWLSWLSLSILGFMYRFSLLPVAGILVNLYLMTQLGASNWFIFLVWLVIGLLVYFGYGYKHSKLNQSA